MPKIVRERIGKGGPQERAAGSSSISSSGGDGGSAALALIFKRKLFAKVTVN